MIDLFGLSIAKRQAEKYLEMLLATNAAGLSDEDHVRLDKAIRKAEQTLFIATTQYESALAKEGIHAQESI